MRGIGQGNTARNDKRCEHRVPPVGNVNFAWVQHMILHLAPAGLPGSACRGDQWPLTKPTTTAIGSASATVS
ncbi:MAG: N-6 DNA methylase [Clostridia bacterium]|nr:N-6 DNA methylase [Clostridia bacterium]